MSRVESSLGAKYSAHNEQARKFEPIVLVGTNYTPAGKVDIAAIRSVAAPTPPKPVVPSVPRPVATLTSSSSGTTFRNTAIDGAAAAARVPEGTWGAPRPTVSAASLPPPAASRPPPTASVAQVESQHIPRQSPARIFQQSPRKKTVSALS